MPEMIHFAQNEFSIRVSRLVRQPVDNGLYFEFDSSELNRIRALKYR